MFSFLFPLIISCMKLCMLRFVNLLSRHPKYSTQHVVSEKDYIVATSGSPLLLLYDLTCHLNRSIGDKLPPFSMVGVGEGAQHML